MKYTRELTLDINPQSKIQTVDVKQGDAASNVFILHIVKDGTPILLTSSHAVKFRCTKPSGYGCCYPITVNENGTATLTLSAESTAEHGLTLADISIEEDGEILSTTAFWMQCRRYGMPDNIGGSNEYVELEQTIAEARELIQQMQGGGLVFEDDGDGNITITTAVPPNSGE